MLWYTIGLVPVTLRRWRMGLRRARLPGGGARHERVVHRLGGASAARRDDAAAQRVFRVSLAYLFALFLAMNVELLARL
jgi:heme O synthase-like polyprenyltransferase